MSDNLILSSLALMEGVDDIHAEYIRIMEKNSILSAREREEVCIRKQLYDYYANPLAALKDNDRCKGCVNYKFYLLLKDKQILPTRTRAAECGICPSFEYDSFNRRGSIEL